MIEPQRRDNPPASTREPSFSVPRSHLRPRVLIPLTLALGTLLAVLLIATWCVQHQPDDDRTRWTVTLASLAVGALLLALCDLILRHTERQLDTARQNLIRSALQDGLTGLANRSLFRDRLGRCIERAKRRPGYYFAVLFLDLDHFKFINESLGHFAGDEMLMTVANRLSTILRTADTVSRMGDEQTLARLGGDEFAILLDDLQSPHDAVRVAQRIQSAMSAPVRIGEQELFPSVSIGIAMHDAGTQLPEHLLRDADTALHRAKAAGRARYEIFDRAMHAAVSTRLQIESDLRKAVELRQFIVHYQPIVSVPSCACVGFEALVRWMHPQRGLVRPDEFISIAEETGLIVPIGYEVLRQAARQLVQWQRRTGNASLSISVNLATSQLREADFAQTVQQICVDEGLDPHNLALELTESALIGDNPATTEALSALRAIGVRLHLDDFGTGYSSLSYLHRYPFEAVKIDRSFVASLTASQERAAIVQAILSLASGLHMQVIAEGVENAEQLARLASMQCRLAQGYYFSAPMAVDKAEQYLTGAGVRVA